MSVNQLAVSVVEAAERNASCGRLKVGAALEIQGGVAVTSYNEIMDPEHTCGIENCKDANGRCDKTIHAERNVLAQASRLGIRTEGATMYVTHFPCLDCTKQIIKSGIVRIYYRDDYRNDPRAIALLNKKRIITEQW